jgi:carboxymethylenebutenolidase
MSTFATRTERIVPAEDDTGGAPTDAFTGLLTLPESGSGPGVLVIHEIGGVNDYVAHVGQRLADLGYVALAPDLFWRVDPDRPLAFDEEGLEDALERVGRLDVPLAVRDADAALAHLTALPEVAGPVGVLGFCLGGTIAFLVALRSEPDAVVSYYGSGVPDAVDEPDALAPLDCPVLFHFGADDPYIPVDQIDRVRAAVEGRSDIEVHVFDAGHAFDNPAPLFHNPEAAEQAWGVTADFLRRSLGP